MSDLLALRVFVEHLVRGPGVDGRALDELCRAHPDLEPSLRQLARERSEAEVDVPRVASLHGRTLRRTPGARERYVLLGQVARGGMGVVLHVWDTVLERPVAMKVLDTRAPANGAGDADEALARFLTEARIAGQLNHPGIVPIHDLGADEHGCVYFTMPRFEGRTLDEAFELARSRGEGWSLGRALRALARVCDVVAHAHARGVVHGDLKPANLIALESGEVYVLDWGLAKVVGDAPAERASEHVVGDAPAAERASEHTVAGTPPYMAPEQAEGRAEEVSFRADVYAIGAMLYRLLAGRAPYAARRGHDEPEKTVELIRRGAPTPLQRLVPDAPAELVAISERAMARAPAARYASVADLARDLRAFEAKAGEVAWP